MLRVSFLQDPGQPPDPDIFYAGQGLLLTTNVYEGLLQYKRGVAKPEIVASLATSWTAAPDNKTFTFELRKGVTFHDGTPFTSAAVKASFDRRLAVNQGPAYMVAGIASVTTPDDYHVVIKLKEPDSAFLGYLASAYGPRMMSPTALKEHAGSDNAQTWLLTHDVGTGPYTITDAVVGSHYAMKAYDGYWGPKPYFTTVDIPVHADLSTQQVLFDKGDLAVIMHDLSQSAVQSYLKKTTVKTYPLPTMMSNFLFVNPTRAFLTTPANRVALLNAIDVDAIHKQAFTGRGTVASQAYPAHMLADGLAKQPFTHDPAALQALVGSLPADQKTITVGYDSASADHQLVANLLSAQLAPYGLTVKVQGFPTAELYGWTGDAKTAPDLLLYAGWPDAASPYTWLHIAADTGGGLNFLHCSTPEISSLLAAGLKTGDDATFGKAGEAAAATGCWRNLINQDDFMVAQPWLKGVEAAHIVSAPNSLYVADLSVG
ncbi:ABC transporter substrate-binding protein [Luedemannella flava]|uniref:ABC transporter substrate-binding protein n=1 Tax=Luedemannella flava TaxID=349316 RepID=A0ABN2LZN8_9ACTN